MCGASGALRPKDACLATSELLIDEMRIRPATVEDVPAVKALLDAVSHWLISRNIRQWNNGSMPFETLRQRSVRGELYVCMCDDEVIGTFESVSL